MAWDESLGRIASWQEHRPSLFCSSAFRKYRTLEESSTVMKALLVSVIFVATSMTALGADDAYPLKLTRPNKVGEKFVVTAREDESKTVSPPGDATSEDSPGFISATFEGAVEIAAVDSNGRPTQLHVVIRELTFATNNGDRDRLAAGTMIRHNVSGWKAHSRILSDGTLTEYQRTALDMIFVGIAPSTSSSDDDVFNDGKPKRVGDSWPMQTAAMVKGWTQMKVGPENAKGVVTLRALRKLGNKPALVVTAKMSVTKIELPDPNTAGAQMDSTFECVVPVDLNDGEMHSVSTTHCTVIMKPQPERITGRMVVVDRKNDIYFKPTN